MQPGTGELWCSVNERDGMVGLGSISAAIRILVMLGKKAALRNRVSMPDVLLQPHSASMEMTFYDGGQFPSEYRGDIFAAFHGSWNRSRRTGYKVVRVLLQNGQPTGEYKDFLTRFVISDKSVWARRRGRRCAGRLPLGQRGW